MGVAQHRIGPVDVDHPLAGPGSDATLALADDTDSGLQELEPVQLSLLLQGYRSRRSNSGRSSASWTMLAPRRVKAL